MRPEFRFPRSTIVLMLVILAGVALAIEQAKTIEVRYSGFSSGLSFWSFVLVTFLAAGVVVAGIWGILFALRRTGVHRLANLQTGSHRIE